MLEYSVIIQHTIARVIAIVVVVVVVVVGVLERRSAYQMKRLCGPEMKYKKTEKWRHSHVPPP